MRGGGYTDGPRIGSYNYSEERWALLHPELAKYIREHAKIMHGAHGNAYVLSARCEDDRTRQAPVGSIICSQH